MPGMFRSWLSRHLSLVITATSVAVVTALVAVVAVVSSGFTAQRMDLGDGSVWVVNGAQQVVGRANTQILALDTVVEGAGVDLEVVQRGGTVLMVDRGNSKVDILDPATSESIDSVPLPPDNPQLFLAGQNVVIGSGGSGEYWILRAADLGRFDAESPPTLSLGADTVASVSPSGLMFVFSAAQKQVYRIDAANSDTVAGTSEAEFGGTAGQVGISSVGGQWVLIDPRERSLFTARGTIDLSAAITADGSPVLQEASDAGDAVLVAWSGGLLRVPLGGGSAEPMVTGRDGRAVPPVLVGSCSYAAWSDGQAWRRCSGGQPVELGLDAVPAAAAALAFLSNGDRVVLNDPRGGGSWAVQSDGELIDNWAELITVRQDERQLEHNDEDTPPEYEKTQAPPVAVDDSLGARPGRASVLPLLLNDYDPNGDALVITDVDLLDEAVGRLDLISQNQQVQLTLAAGASGSLSFGYSIGDGRGGSARATVTVTVKQPGENSAPQQLRQTKALVAAGGRVTTSVLGDWIDPEGDAFYLGAASAAAPDTVSHKPEGSVVFTEAGAASALRSVSLIVSDGRAQGAGGLTVTVRPAGEVPIIADPFVVLAYSGQELTISPLRYVRGGTGTLRLAGVATKAATTITASLDSGTFTFSSQQVGTHYLDYVVNDGDDTATGLVRVDVAAPPDPNSKPITIPKTVFVTTLSNETVDVAATDIDPAGAVLLLTAVYSVGAASGVRAEAIEQRLIRVTLTAPLDNGPVSFNYRVSNGLAESEGLVTVVEIPQPTRFQPPVALDDAVTVRVGAAIDIPVLDNDSQPDGEELSLNPLLSSGLKDRTGLLFASGRVLRYLAPEKTGDFTAIYEVTAPDGQTAQAQVSIAVREPVEATNNPPVPVTVVGRVLAGETVRVSIPLGGIDPDGDSVQLLGQETSPQKGSVIEVGTDYVDFEAGDYSAGTDSFSYMVVDGLGARASGTVRIGISPKREGARNPVAIEDEVTIRPGATVSVQVLANDSDPDGGPLTVTEAVPNSAGVIAAVDGDQVKVTPPRAPGRYGVVYSIENDVGGTSSNFITVVVDPDAPPARPIVDDTVVTLTDILDRDSFDANVLSNVFFAEGDVRTLEVSLLPGYASSATVLDNKRIKVRVQDESQIIPFAVANPDDPKAVGYAFVWVPGLDDALPQLNRKAKPLTVASEAELRIDLDEYVLAIGGKRVRLTDATTVKATHSNGQNPVIDDHSLRFTSAEKYFGPASISFEVTDGSSASDPDGRKASLVLPIRVTPRENQPPSFVGGVIDFEPAQSKEIDLVRLTDYPYPDDLDELAYTVLSPLPEDFSYTLTGQKLVIRADEAAVKNSTTAISIAVRDDLAAGRSGRIQLNVVASSRPLARPAADVATATRNQSTVVDVLANDEATNPFPGEPLKVVAIRGLDDGSLPEGVTITPNADRSKLTVTVADSAVPGDSNLQYQVADATGDPDRYVWGSVRISVQDTPDPVTGVTMSAFGDRSITLRWNPGNANNSPITGYQVLMYTPALELISTTDCSAAVCEISTPGNGPDNAVRVRVVAQNGIGTSTPVGIGNSVWSDIVPAAPTSVEAAPLDGGLRISWPVVPDPAGGTPVDSYSVTAGGASTTVSASHCGSSCSVDVGGLTNAQAVAVSVSARNGAYGALADWNSTGTTGTPAGPPIANSAPTASATDSTATVNWAGAFDDNGSPITKYYASVYSSSAPSCSNLNPPGSDTVDAGTSTSSAFAVASGSTYSAIVIAINDPIGPSGPNCTSGPAVVVHTVPGAVAAATFDDPSRHGSVYDATLASVTVDGGSASGSYSFYYRMLGAEYGPISLDGFLSTGDGAHYGDSTLTVELRACLNGVCQPSYSSFPLGVTPVDPRIDRPTFTQGGLLTPSSFDWLQWPVGSYENIQYSCQGGFDDAATTGPGRCELSGLSSDPTLTIRVIANGGQRYDVDYDKYGNIRP
ncbi:Ig-like domain-containing protein [soil metagenome]